MIAFMFGIVVGSYLTGFVGALWLNVSSGPVTLDLAIYRAAVWPIWLATGWPEGKRRGPD